jgi:hypothetical protein
MRILAVLLVTLLATSTYARPRASKALLNTLQTRRISVKFEKATLDQFVRYVRLAAGINIVVRKDRIERDGGDPDAIEITLKVNDVRLIDVLRLGLETQDLGLAVRGNVLLITSKRDARGKPVLVVYDVADILIPIRDFPGPDINVYPSSYEPPEPPEPEVSRSVESADELAELVRQFTGRDTWDDEGVSVQVFRRHLFIRQYPAVHREISRFLVAVRGLR